MPTYTAPTTRASGFLVTASVWNTDIVENIKYFKDAPVFDTAVIIGAATTAGIRLDLESGTLAVREGDDSAYAPLTASIVNLPSGGSVNFASGDVTLTHSTNTLTFAGAASGYIFNDGNVGIGVTPKTFTSGKVVEIGAAGNIAWGNGGGDMFLASNLYYNADFKYAATNAIAAMRLQDGVVKFLTAPSGTADTTATLTERFRVLNGGNIAIGATARLYLDGVAGTGDTYIAEGSTGNTIEFYLGNTRRTLMTAAALELFGTTGVGLRSTGAGTSTGTAIVRNSSDEYFYLQSSSRRFKENISAAVVTDAQLDAFMATTPSWWDYKGQKNGALGFIAEDLAALPMERYGFNPLVNYDGDGLVESNRDYALIAIHHLVIQRLERKIAALEARIH